MTLLSIAKLLGVGAFAAVCAAQAVFAKEPAAPTPSSQRAAVAPGNVAYQHVTFMDGKLAINLPADLKREPTRMLRFSNSQAGVVIGVQPGASKMAPQEFLDDMLVDAKKEDKKLVILNKGEIKVGNYTLQKVEYVANEPGSGKVYNMAAIGIRQDRVFAITVAADASQQNVWAARAEQILQSLTDV